MDNLREELEALAKVLGLNLQLESRSEGAVSRDDSESEHGEVGLAIEGIGQEQQQQLVQPDGLNSFARQLEEQLSSCHKEKPLELEVGSIKVGNLEVDNMEVGKLEVGNIEVGKLEVGNIEVGKQQVDLELDDSEMADPQAGGL